MKSVTNFPKSSLVICLGLICQQLAGVVVTNLNNSGPGSFRDAVDNASAGEVVTFGLAGRIELESYILLNRDITIIGHSDGTTIAGAPGFRQSLFKMLQGQVVIRDMQLKDASNDGQNGQNSDRAGGGGGGGAGMGGAIAMQSGDLSLIGIRIENCYAIGGNGGNGNGGFGSMIGGGGSSIFGGGNASRHNFIYLPLNGINGGFGGGGSGSAWYSGGIGGFGGGGGGSGIDNYTGGLGGSYGGQGGAGVSLYTSSIADRIGGGGGGGAGMGGAVFVKSGTLTVENCWISNNHAEGGNGGIGYRANKTQHEDVRSHPTGPVDGSPGQGVGGAIFMNSGTKLVTRGLGNIVNGNSATDASDNYHLEAGAEWDKYAPIVISSPINLVFEKDIGETSEWSGIINITDSDPQDNPRFADTVVEDAYGEFSLMNGNYTYTLDQESVQHLGSNDRIEHTVRLTATDGTVADIQIDIIGQDDAPQVSAENLTTNEQSGTYSGQLDATDPDSDILTFNTEASLPGFTLASNGSYQLDTSHSAYTDLVLGESYTQEINWSVSDETGESTTGVLSLVVNGVNGAPTANDWSGSPVLSATSASGQLSAQDDESSASLHYQLLSGTAGLTIATSGTFYFDLSNAAYRAAAQGEDFPVSASWRVSDAHGAFSEASLAFTLSGNNEAPYSVNASATATEDGDPLSGQLQAGDVDNNAQLNFSSVSGFSGLTIHNDGTYSFDPGHPDYQSLAPGDTQLLNASWQVTDEHGQSAAGTLEIVISGENDLPSTQDWYRTPHLSTGSATGQLSASDIDNASGFTYSLVQGTEGLIIHPDGSFAFDLSSIAYLEKTEGETYFVSGVWQVADPHGATANGQLGFSLAGQNDAPVATNYTASVAEDGSLYTGQLSALDYDPGSSLTFTEVSGLAGLTIQADGGFTFDPSHADWQEIAEGQTRTVTAEWSVSDEQGASSVEALQIHISGENDAPVVSGDTTMVVNHFETAKAQIEIIMDRVEGTQGPAQTRTLLTFPESALDSHGSVLHSTQRIYLDGWGPNPVAIHCRVEDASNGDVLFDAPLQSYYIKSADLIDIHSEFIAQERFHRNPDWVPSPDVETPHPNLWVNIDDGTKILNGGEGDTDHVILWSGYENYEDQSVYRASQMHLKSAARLMVEDVDSAILTYNFVEDLPSGLEHDGQGNLYFDPTAAFLFSQQAAVGEWHEIILPWSVTDETNAGDSGTLTIQIAGTAQTVDLEILSTSLLEARSAGAGILTLSSSEDLQNWTDFHTANKEAGIPLQIELPESHSGRLFIRARFTQEESIQ
ncbi:MAG: VCBS domain-containing protein [Coraliomargaritaceae bacterium]